MKSLSVGLSLIIVIVAVAAVMGWDIRTQGRQGYGASLPSPVSGLSCSEPTFDVSLDDFQGSIKHTFVVNNTTSRPVAITSSRVSCTCETLQLPQGPIPPGGSAEATLEMKLTPTAAEQVGTVALVGDNAGSSVVLRLKATRSRHGKVIPPGLYFHLDKGVAAKPQYVEIPVVQSKTPFKITGANANDPTVAVLKVEKEQSLGADAQAEKFAVACTRSGSPGVRVVTVTFDTVPKLSDPPKLRVVVEEGG